MSPLFFVASFSLAAAIALAPRVVFFGFGEDARIVREAGFSTFRLAGLIMALAFGLPRSHEREALGLLLSRPLTPASVLVGRFFGALLVTLAALTMLSVVLYGTLTFSGMDSRGIGAEWFRACLEAGVTVALAAAAATLLSRGVAALAVLAVFALAHANTALSTLLPSDGSIAAAALAATAYVAFGAAVAEAGEAGA